MVQTYSDGKNIYSVDMIFAYVNIFKPESKNVEVSKYVNNLEHKSWGSPKKNIYYSPMQVINNPKAKKYKSEITRIEKANLRYPIIITGNYVVDGVHRLTKAYLNKKKKIKAIVFTKTQMRKFLINSNKDWDKVDQMQTYDFIKLFHQRFCQK